MDRLRPALQESVGRSKPWAGARLVNAFPEQSEGDKAEMFAVMALPGLGRKATIDPLACRGLHVMAGVLYAVAGGTLYSVDSSWAGTPLGTITGQGPVVMADNGSELAICGGTTGYVLSGGVLHTGIENLPAVSSVTYCDGYFVWPVYQSDQFIISGLNDGLSYDPLDVATAEGSPDFLVTIINDHRELHLMGADSDEVWYNSGDADFPFARQGNAFIEKGCLSRDSVVKIDNGFNFVTTDRTVERMLGYQPTRISTHAIERYLAKAAWFIGFTYTQEGHKFYVLNTDVGCFAYDMATGAWAIRKSYGMENYRAAYSVQAYGQTVFGGLVEGKLYTPDLDLFTEDGQPIQVLIDPPPLDDARKRRNLYAFELYCETGVGELAANDPQVILSYSRDGGRLWSNQMTRSLGSQGAYLTRAIWRVNVEFLQLQLRIEMPSSTRRFVMGYYADVR